jgi:hypothetical protein
MSDLALGPGLWHDTEARIIASTIRDFVSGDLRPGKARDGPTADRTDLIARLAVFLSAQPVRGIGLR